MKYLRTIITIYLLCFASFSIFSASREHEGKIINSIRFEGIRSFEPSMFIFRITSSVGSRLSYEQLSLDIKKLYEEELFEEIEVFAEAVNHDSVDLLFLVVERPTVTSISIIGNNKISDRQIRDKIKQKEFSIYSRQKVSESIRAINDLYIEEGYSFAQIDLKEEFRDNNRVDLTFNIDEGEKLRVIEINFVGNRVISDRRLARSIKSKRRNHLLFTWLTGRDVYKLEKISEDIEKIIELYHDRGFLRVQVREPKVEVVDRGRKRRIVLTYRINEGKRYNINNIDITGAEKIEKDSLLPLIDIEERMIYDGSKVKDTIEAFQNYYQNRGYIYARIFPEMEIDDENRLVDITFDIIENNQMYLRRIYFTGNNITKDKVIRREFFLREGDIFSIDPFIAGMKRLHYLGYFSEVEPEIIDIDDEDDKVDLEIKVVEQGKNQIEFGGGYSTNDKFYFHGGFMTQNLLGTGLDFAIRASTGERTRAYEFKITNPWLFDYPVFSEFEIYRRKIEYIGYKNLTKGAGIRFGRRLSRYTNAFVSYSFDTARVTDVNMNFFFRGEPIRPLPPEEDTEFFGLWIGERDTSQVTLSLVNDRRNRQVNASSGSRNAFYTSLAGGILAGDNKFYSFTYDSIYYLPLIGPLFLGCHGRVSYIKPYGGSFLPTTKKLFLGGDYSVRGFRNRSIGPKNERGVVIGGNKSLLFNFELTLPISEVFWLVAFYDAGNVFDESESYAIDDLRDSIGLEFRIMIPALYLPIRFIYAVNINPQKNEDKRDFFFGFGTTF